MRKLFVSNNTEKYSPDLASLYCLGGGVILSALPHGQRIPIWIMVIFLVLTLWKLYTSTKLQHKNNHNSTFNILLLLLIAAGFTGIYFEYGTLVGRSAGVSLLVLLAGFKILEIKSERDFYVSCCLGYFLVITNFLYTQTIGTAIYMAFTVLVMTVSLITFNNYEQRLTFKSASKIASTLLLQAIPVMLVLFVLFPRVSGPLWGMPDDAHSGLTGIDDEMSPGSISNLIQSNKVAFRVDFKGEIPEQSQLYWRGPVLWHTDGRKWVRHIADFHSQEELQSDALPVQYTVTLEPHNQKWLYSLDIPKHKTETSILTTDFQLLTRKPVSQRVRYDMSSHQNFNLSELTKNERKNGLWVPKKIHTQTKEMIRSWLDEGLTESEIIDRALQFFNEGEFYYTLTPPLLEKDRVDQFLFETKQGFCEHYASAFVVMMRAAGIPARIVLGYQGGEKNPVGDYFIVHQRNAHAWTEVWLKDEGWKRIDPTAAVSPLRVIEGIESALPDESLGIPIAFSGNELTLELWQRLRYRWDAVNNQWNQWVISYGPKRQKELLNKFGLEKVDWSNLIFLLTGSVMIILMYIVFVVFKLPPKDLDPVVVLYQKFCKKLSRAGIERFVYEGPKDFAKRASLKRKDLAEQIEEITENYIAVRYTSNHGCLKTLKNNINSFRT